MLHKALGKSIVMKRVGDGESFVGVISSVEAPLLMVKLETSESAPALNSEVLCHVGDGISYLRIEGVVTGAETETAEVWMRVQTIVEGVDRAPRAQATGNVVKLIQDDEEISGSLCDCSETGLRISTLTPLRIGAEIALEIANGSQDSIKLKAKVVRTHQEVGSVYIDAGLQITEVDRLNRARWNHFVNSLLKQFGVVTPASR